MLETFETRQHAKRRHPGGAAVVVLALLVSGCAGLCGGGEHEGHGGGTEGFEGVFCAGGGPP